MIGEGTSGYTVAINAEKFVRCERDASFRALVQRAVAKVPDGAGAVLALRWLWGVRSAKVDFPRATLRAADEMGNPCRLAVIGASEESLRKACTVIHGMYPNAHVVLTRSGFASESQLLHALADARPNLCLVAMGTPKQERFAQTAIDAGIRCLFVGCGGALDILSGHATRAPRWMVDNYLEWLYRLWQQPSRWRRQTALLVFAKQLMRSWLATKLGGAQREVR
jgi:N-acetylglucosaminyldiphosphoundecaprenol N-acetyl-beta-D-mannosaminyltransferase